ncbi:bifunctional riboflavin kinase/FAD synthetase [Actinobaculum suis]|uniref:Riboflavin biosynthesis protein n=1 Tax=Actinobaculum suis TaxID=1657 RepID=A0AAW9HJ25_9ACTO|nr:bifunctional riboflavin kinase/FAD synthetase [Actinobaculum suis]MDY5153920.1 bifunctional riboflavin kinase/FAD synthetase [Actinobaculum suis]
MQIWRRPEDIPADLSATAVTFGIFDGVHRGHRAILRRTVEMARTHGWMPVVLTFDPHPATIHNPKSKVPLIINLEDRLNRIAASGIGATYVQDYSLAYAQASPQEFFTRQLMGQLRARGVVVGEDARFGRGNAGDTRALLSLGQRFGVDIDVVSDLCGPDGQRWSSTKVRELLEAGNVSDAAEILGRPHRIRGVVEHGAKRGRELGFPTANLSGSELGEVPADGVYAGWLVRAVPGTRATEYLPAAISVGSNPQFGAKSRTVEAHVLGRSDLNLYGEEISVEFIAYIRPMMKFDEVSGLQARMDQDLLEVADKLGVPPAVRLAPGQVTAQ